MFSASHQCWQGFSWQTSNYVRKLNFSDRSGIRYEKHTSYQGWPLSSLSSLSSLSPVRNPQLHCSHHCGWGFLDILLIMLDSWNFTDMFGITYDNELLCGSWVLQYEPKTVDSRQNLHLVLFFFSIVQEKKA